MNRQIGQQIQRKAELELHVHLWYGPTVLNTILYYTILYSTILYQL